MQDYENKGHMSLVSTAVKKAKEICVLPHQPVFRTESLTTAIRVVFDASSRTSNGNSLNDKLKTGPNLQTELFAILLKFRAYQFVFTADIEAMYRQILISEEDRHLQRILWRSDASLPIQTYSLTH